MEENTKQLKDRLAASFEAIRVAEERALVGQLALEVMHEIRNPLEALGNLIYLAERTEDSEDLRRFLSLAREQVANASEISNRTLAFARASQSAKQVDMVELAEASIRLHQRKIAAKKVRLVRNFSDDLVVRAHLDQLFHVVSNLITNALDAVDDEGVLCLRIRKRQNEIQIVVADNGCGIPAEHTEKIFQPFFTTKADRGNGLGLALSKRIVERHKGKIRAQQRETGENRNHLQGFAAGAGRSGTKVISRCAVIKSSTLG